MEVHSVTLLTKIIGKKLFASYEIVTSLHMEHNQVTQLGEKEIFMARRRLVRHWNFIKIIKFSVALHGGMR